MKKPMRKVKKFDNGGLSKAQEEWLGGADRTDPFIMARMRKAVPDEVKTEAAPAKAAPAKAEPAKAEVKTETKTTSEDIFDETGVKSKFKRNQETGDLYTLDDTVKPAAKPAAKTASSSSSTSTSSAKPAEKPAAKTEAKPAKTVYIPNKDATADNRDIGEKKPAPPKPDPSPGRLGFRGDFFSGRPYGSEKFEKEQRSKRSMEAEGNYRKGGSVKKMASGGKVKSASARADGCAIRGKTRA